MCGKLRYGQLDYNFDDGIMFFISPHQVFRVDAETNSEIKQLGWMLLIHPDLS